MNFFNRLLWIYMLIAVCLVVLNIYKVFSTTENVNELKNKFSIYPVPFGLIKFLYVSILILLLPIVPVGVLIDLYNKYHGGK